MKKSEDQPKKKRYHFNLAENQLSPTQWNYLNIINIDKTNEELEEQDKAIWNISDYQYTFYKKLGESLTLIHWILQQKHNLKEKDLNEVFNASTLGDTFQNLLKDKKFDYLKDLNDVYRYDLRTVGMARTMLELSLDYLKQNPQFEDNPNVIENANRILADYKSFEFSLIPNKELPKKEIKKKKYQKLKENIDKIVEISDKMAEELGILQSNFEFEFGIEDKIETFEGLKNYISEMRKTKIIELSRLIISSKHSKNKERHDKSVKELEKLEKYLNNIEKLEKKRQEWENLAKSRYDNIEHFFCKFDPIKPWMIEI